MKRLTTAAILVLLVVVVGCAPKQQIRVMYISDPPGGTLYKQTGELWGPCPKVVRYDVDAKALGRGYLETEGSAVRWPTGPDKESGKLIRITVNGTDRRVIFTQPQDEPHGPADAAVSQESEAPDQKQTERYPMRESQTVEAKPVDTTVSLNSERAAVAARPAAAEKPPVAKKPAFTGAPLGRPAGLILTLSEQQLVLLDWQRANRGGARVESKRPVGGRGVEFDIYFPSNTPGNCSLSFVSTGEGGRGSLVGTDVRGYDTFALKLTLVSVNGRSDRAMKQKLVAGAVIGPTAGGRLTSYEPVTLSLAASERTVMAKTQVSTNEIYEIGFHIRALNREDWDPSGSRVVLLVEPAER